MDWLIPAAHAQADTAAQAAQTASKAADTLITQGGIYGSIAVIVGLAVLGMFVVLGLVIRSLWGTIQARDVLIANLQDKRAADAGQSSKLLAEVGVKASETIAGNVGTLAKTIEEVQRLNNGVDRMAAKTDQIQVEVSKNGDKLDDVLRVVDRGYRT